MPPNTPSNLRWAYAVIGTDMSSKAKVVALVCALRYMGWSNLRNVRPGVPRLVRDTGLSASSVQRALDELCERRYLKLWKRGHTGSASVYHGTWPNARSRKVALEVAPWACPTCEAFGRSPANMITQGPVCVDCLRN